ncbi:MAG: dihydropteroate synthase [Ignavibacteriales bacterium]|nr:dihydropteroate synthase [Ignavibacteriales bacterium]
MAGKDLPQATPDVTMSSIKDQHRFYIRGIDFDFLSRTHIMGILNVTPDSFSDGGLFFDTTKAVVRGLQMVEEGADIIDIGGESTRPGSEPVAEEQEIERVVPVVERLSREVNTPLSIDTCKAGVAEAALAAGASIINDISGMTFDPLMMGVAHKHAATVVLMHIKGTPRTMQQNPQYDNVIREVFEFLSIQSEKAREHGITQIIVDPGIGFGKNLEQNLDLVKGLKTFSLLGCPVLVGPSRKSFIGKLLDLPVEERLEGTAAAVTACILHGAHIVRVHDVKEMKRVACVADALKGNVAPL